MKMIFKNTLLLLALFAIFSCKNTNLGVIPQKIWIVTHEVNNYEDGFSQLDIGFLNTSRIENTFYSISDNADFSGIASSACTVDELGWWGVEEEGLPINGSVWIKYLTDSIIDPGADVNGNGYISFEEAFNHSRVLTQDYMRNYVLSDDGFRKDLGMEDFPYLDNKYPNPVLLKSSGMDFELFKL